MSEAVFCILQHFALLFAVQFINEIEFDSNWKKGRQFEIRRK